MHRISRYAEIARVSNAPTAATNVFAGAAIALDGSQIPALSVGTAAVAACLLYSAGMVMNDLADLKIDRLERPERPIPSGRITPGEACGLLAILLIFAFVLLGFIGGRPATWGGILLLAIAAYNLLHKKSAWASALMGICRGLLYIIAAAAVVQPLRWDRLLPFALILAIYTILITLYARNENELDGKHAAWIPAAIFIPPIVAIFLVSPDDWLLPAIAALLLSGWLIYSGAFAIRTPPNPKRAILGWIAGIALLDALITALLGRPSLFALCLAAFGLTTLSHRRIPGT